MAAEDETGHPIVEDECAVGKFHVSPFVEAALSGPRDEPFPVKLLVNCIGTVLAWVKL
jgi:hypothetical protein